MIEKATAADTPQILKIYESARAFMAQNGNPNQWGKIYPPAEVTKADIEQGILYVLRDKEGIYGVFAFILGEDPTYGVIYEGSWESDAPYGAIHRVASSGRKSGVLKEIVPFCEQTTSHLRIDTHADNKPMQRAVSACGFTYRGIIHTHNGTPRLAFEKTRREKR